MPLNNAWYWFLFSIIFLINQKLQATHINE
nr:MAG TPA: hypothetical protein [Caudoviricetes sp.]